MHTAITCLTLLAAGVLAVSAYSDLVSPTVWIVAAYLGLAFPVILICNLLLLIFLILTRRWHPMLLLLAALLICSPRIWRYCPMHFGQQEALTNVMTENGVEKACPIDTFRVLTYNTRSTGNLRVANLEDKVPVLEMVRSSRADVVCLQEYHFSLKKGHTEQQLRSLLKMEYPYYYLLLNSGSTTMGTAVFSKWPILLHEKIDTEAKKYFWASYLELDVHGRRVSLVNCHLQNQAISKENRDVFRQQTRHFETDSLGRMEDGLRELSPAFRNRTRQVAAINRYLRDRRKKWDAKHALLICGDMNDTPVSFAYHALRGNLDDAWQDAGFGPGITFRELPFWFRIDHIFHSEHFRTLDVQVLRDATWSDHYPVMATFQLVGSNDN